MSDNQSHNIAFFGWLSWGEGWHNNHHAFPSSANFGFRWYHVDLGYYMIRLLELCGLAWDVRKPNRRAIEQKIARHEAALNQPNSEVGSTEYDFDHTEIEGAGSER